MYFCIRDDDTSFFTTPEALENAYEGIRGGPISLAVIPFCRAGTSAFVPERYQKRWSVHPLHENTSRYLRASVAQGRYEVMLHGFHHDEPDGRAEFAERRSGPALLERVTYGRKYLEDLIGAPIRVFVPPSNGLNGNGLSAIVQGGLHLGGAAGVRGGWKRSSLRTWKTWLRLRSWRTGGGLGVPWVLDMGDHKEIPGNPVTPSSRIVHTEAVFDSTRSLGGAFCAATHYWEFSVPSIHPGDPNVGNQLRRLVDRVIQDSNITWRSVGDTLTQCRPLII
jgi:hypothetical protein